MASNCASALRISLLPRVQFRRDPDRQELRVEAALAHAWNVRLAVREAALPRSAPSMMRRCVTSVPVSVDDDRRTMEVGRDDKVVLSGAASARDDTLPSRVALAPDDTGEAIRAAPASSRNRCTRPTARTREAIFAETSSQHVPGRTFGFAREKAKFATMAA